MSFIAPITDYQSSQYANRTIGKKEGFASAIKSTIPINPLYLSRRKEEKGVDKELTNKEKNGEPKQSMKIHTVFKKVPYDVLQKTSSEITEKGKFINEYI